MNSRWEGCIQYKTPTALKYDESLKLISWGDSALSQRPRRNRRNKNSDDTKLVENFLLHLSNMEHKPHLPEGLTYKHAIVDYLIKMGELIKHTLMSCWPCIDFFGNVLVIMPVLKFS